MSDIQSGRGKKGNLNILTARLNRRRGGDAVSWICWGGCVTDN